MRYAIRALRSRPAFSLIAILSLAVGIAANTAIFSVVNALLFARVPGVQQSERLVHVTRDVNAEAVDLSHAAIRHLRGERGVVEVVGAYALARVSTVVEGTEPRIAAGLAVEADYFTALGVRTSHGRLFTHDEADYRRAAAVAVISEHLWEREFGRRANVVGSTIRVNGIPVQLVGITADEFAGHHAGMRFDIFLPLGLQVPRSPFIAFAG